VNSLAVHRHARHRGDHPTHSKPPEPPTSVMTAALAAPRHTFDGPSASPPRVIRPRNTLGDARNATYDASVLPLDTTTRFSPRFRPPAPALVGHVENPFIAGDAVGAQNGFFENRNGSRGGAPSSWGQGELRDDLFAAVGTPDLGLFAYFSDRGYGGSVDGRGWGVPLERWGRVGGRPQWTVAVGFGGGFPSDARANRSGSSSRET